MSDARLPNIEAAEEHFDGSQIRVENRQFRALLKLANPSADAGSRGQSLPRIGKPTIKPSRSGCRLRQRRSARARTDSACVRQFRNRQWRTDGGLARLSPFPFVLCILVHNGGSDAQVDRCCFCFGRRNFRPGHVARAASSTERHDHASPPTSTVLRPRSGTKMGLSTMRGKWHLHVGGTSPGPQTGLPQVCRME